MQVIAGLATEELSSKIAFLLGSKLITPTYKTFPDGESYIKIEEQLIGDILVVQSCFPPQDTNLFNLLNLVTAIKSVINTNITAYVPYLCYARSDKQNSPGEAISSKTVIRLLESVGIDHLITLDVHNPDIFKYCNKMKCTNIFPSISMKNYLLSEKVDIGSIQIIAPDQGAIYRARSLAKSLNIDYTVLKKSRDPISGEVGLEIGEAKIHKSEIVIIDDIISTGSTLVEAGNLLSLYNVKKIHFLITHAIGTQAVDKLKEFGNGLVVATNSIPSYIGKISTEFDLIDVIKR